MLTVKEKDHVVGSHATVNSGFGTGAGGNAAAAEGSTGMSGVPHVAAHVNLSAADAHMSQYTRYYYKCHIFTVFPGAMHVYMPNAQLLRK